MMINDWSMTIGLQEQYNTYMQKEAKFHLFRWWPNVHYNHKKQNLYDYIDYSNDYNDYKDNDNCNDWFMHLTMIMFIIVEQYHKRTLKEPKILSQRGSRSGQW